MNKLRTTILSCVLVFGILCSGCTNYADRVKDDIKDTKRTYSCDYHTFSWKTKITFTMDGEEYEIN